MSKKQHDIPQPNKPFSLRVLYAGQGVNDVVFSYQGIRLFQPLSDDEYREYRKLCYLRPVRAKNHLLDLVNFDTIPYRRAEFHFTGKDDEPSKEMIALWQAIEKSL